MKLLLLGKRGSITGWLEEAARAFRADGHEVEIAHVRNPWIAAPIEEALGGLIGDRITARAKRFGPELILAVGGFHVPLPILERLAAWRGHPPIAGWVGDVYGLGAARQAAQYDVVAYTDTGLYTRHREMGLRSASLFAPHAVDPATPVPERKRQTRMVFVANPTKGRLAAVKAIRAPITVHGQGWPNLKPHRVHARRAAPRALPGIYASHLASLNVKNETNVLHGLNQRHFQPPLAGTPLVSDAQPDLHLAFESGREVLVWRNFDELNEIHERLLAHPEEAQRVGEAARRRVLAEHTYAVRLKAFLASVR
jgi:spore maturation protein CgeB